MCPSTTSLPAAGATPGATPCARVSGEGTESPETGTDTLVRPEERTRLEKPWIVIVWNDPVNLMSYVSYVFRRHFGFSAARANELMLQVHHQGKAVVASGTREEAERHVEAMHGYGLWATLEQPE